MLAQLAERATVRRGLRPLNPLTDLGRVADLIELAFKEDTPFTGGEFLAEMRRWAAMAPLHLLLTPLENGIGGFVWEEDGQIVGNVSVGLLQLGGDDWLISNVAVHPRYRRRGIARQLVVAALDLIRRQNGEYALLQVRHDNEVALGLYESLGFARFATSIELRRLPEPSRHTAPPTIAGASRYSAGYRSAVMRLVRSQLPPRYVRFRPLVFPGAQMAREGSFESWLDDLFARRRTRRLVVRDGKRIEAFLAAELQLRHDKYHRVFVAVDARARGVLAGPLAQEAAAWLDAYPASAALTTVLDTDYELRSALQASGFHDIRTLEQMQRRISV